jgi:hypothetical protein
MHVHTDRLTSADLREALRVTGLASRGVYLDCDREVSEHRSRKRARRIDFYLVATDGYGRRWTNSGQYGRGYNKAPPSRAGREHHRFGGGAGARQAYGSARVGGNIR